MVCLACGSENQEDSKFCRACGASLAVVPAIVSSPQDADDTRQEEPNPVVIPDDAVVVAQTQWAYLLHTIPWLVLLVASFMFDFFTFGIVPIVAATYIIGSQYLSYRRTAYILTESHLVIYQGTLFGRRRIDVLFTEVNNVLAQPGIFGRYLGYTGLRLELVGQRVAFLQYVPLTSPLLKHLRFKMKPDSPQDEEPTSTP